MRLLIERNRSPNAWPRRPRSSQLWPSANLAVEFSGPDSAVLLDLARRTVEMLKTIRGAVDVNIEQEGPQPQLIIHPDRALCARYNVRIEDVTKLINTALGGDPIGVVYEGERKLDSSPNSIARR